MPLKHLREEGAAVFGDAEKSRPATQQSGRDSALERVRCREVGQARRDGCRREAVVGECDEHGLEDACLPRTGATKRMSQ